MSNLLVLTFFTIYVFIDTHQQYSLILCPVTSASSNPVDSCAPLSPPDAFFTALPNFLFFFLSSRPHGRTERRRCHSSTFLLPFLCFFSPRCPQACRQMLSCSFLSNILHLHLLQRSSASTSSDLTAQQDSTISR